MSIFTNIHKVASRIIPRQTIEWRKGEVSVLSAAGIMRSQHGEWIKIKAHAQPGIVSSFGGKNITEKDYKEMGLDWSHRFFTIWTDDQNITTIAKQETTDQIRIGGEGGEVYNIIHIADWLEFDGWKRCYCEQVIDN